jgi:SSS family solute:Na+ symporter
MNITAISSFLFFICLVAIISVVKARRKKSATAEVFPSKRTYNFIAVGCALFFTNISAAEFIGGSEAAYTNNMTTMAWGVSSVFAMLLVSEFIIPIYMRGAISTTPDFLAMRYDNSTKLLVTLIFLLSYVFNLLPIILYTGAVALNGLFHFQTVWHISYPAAICLLVIALGIIGCTYTVMGGLKVIMVSDILLGLCLFAGGVLLAYFGLKYVGDGSWQQGLQQIVTTRTEHLNAIGSETDAVPFSGIFTGMFLINLFYWGTEQVIVQQALSARDLQASQKGIALACFGKTGRSAAVYAARYYCRACLQQYAQYH